MLPPFDEQAAIFLKEAWKVLPDQGVLGLSANAVNMRNSVPHVQMISDWVYAENRANYDGVEWAREHNSNALNIQHEAGNIYYNIASRKASILRREAWARGGFDELIACGLIGLEFDCAEAGYPIEQAYSEVMQYTLPPSAVVNSGGGIHALWFLSEAWSVLDRDSAKEYKYYSLGFAHAVAEIMGIEPDYHINEPARILRLPGFYNRKAKRNNAPAELMYWQPAERYSIDQIKARGVFPPAKERRIYPAFSPEDPGTYAVSRGFIDYFINNRVPVQSTRHNIRLYIACAAARSGIPREVLEPRFNALVYSWPGTAVTSDEINGILHYAYEVAEDDNEEQRSWVVRPTENGFEQVIDLEAEQQVKADKFKVIDKVPESPDMLPLPELRKDMGFWLSAYRALKPRHVGTLALNRASPGTGKTRAALYELLQYVQADRKERDPNEPIKGRGLFLTMFQQGWDDGLAWLRTYGIDPADYPKNMFGWLIARNSDQTSKGYCAALDRAEAFGQKGHNVRQSVCSYCPFKPQCEESWYLSQFKELERREIVFARHQHGMMRELVDQRKFTVIDESPLHIVQGAIEVAVQYMTPSVLNLSASDQYPEELALFFQFLQALLTLVGSLQKPERNSLAHIKLHGFWLMDNLSRKLGPKKLKAVLTFDKSVIDVLSAVRVANLSEIPPNYIPALMGILKHEYETYYEQGVKAWNSRIVPYGNTLRLYPMEPYRFTQNTHITVLDGTGLPDLYPLAFADMQGRERQLIPYNKQIQPPDSSKVFQFTDTENTKNTVLSHKEQIDKLEPPEIETVDGVITEGLYTLKDTYGLAAQLKTVGNAALAQTIILTHHLANKHKGNLLVVGYKSLFGSDEDSAFFRKWIKRSGVVKMANVQWFGNLRGRNDFEHIEAVFVIGTPRIREDELLMLSQAWYWRDASPIQVERAMVEVPYPGYADEGGKGRAYRVWGYKDERVNTLYLHMIQSELRQCMDRIRADSSLTAKTIYLGTAIPCASHVTDFWHWTSTHVHIAAKVVLEEYRERFEHQLDEAFDKAIVAADIATRTSASQSTARKVMDNEIATGESSVDGKSWLEIFKESLTLTDNEFYQKAFAELRLPFNTSAEQAYAAVQARYPRRKLSKGSAAKAWHSHKEARLPH